MQNNDAIMQRSHNHRFPLLKNALLAMFLLLSSNITLAQLTLTVTVDIGNSTTTCTDPFGSPDPLWRVNIDGSGWNTYSNGNSSTCHEEYPKTQYSITVDCEDDLPASLEVCFRAFENDGIFCNLNETCIVEECPNFVIPTLGNSDAHTITLPTGMDSGGTLDFTIALSGTSVATTNDEICGAEDLGILSNGGIVGDASAGGFNNICSSNTNDVNPDDDGEWFNEQGVWVQFTTDATPGYELLIEALNDPTNIGNVMNLQLALYSSDDGTCSGNLTLEESAFATGIFDESILFKCPEPNTTYFILVDGNFFSDETEGYFGIQVSDSGGIMGGEKRCDAIELGMVPIGGNVGITNQANHCADNINDPNPSAFISQKSVWYNFQAPPSGHVIIDAVSSTVDPIGLQLALYRSFNNMCSGFFFEVESVFTSQGLDETLDVQCLNPGDNYWILIDGSGSFTEGLFDLTVNDGGIYPPMMTNDTTVCFGQTVSVGTSTYSESNSYTFVFQLSNGCDSTVITNLTVADSLEAIASQIQPASSATSSDGTVTVDMVGGVAPFTFQWDNGATTQTVTGLPIGTYCVIVTDSIGCTADDCIMLDYSTIVATLDGSTLLCNGDDNGTVSISVQDGTAPYDFTYSNVGLSVTGSGTLNSDSDVVIVENLPAGSYLFLVEDAAGATTFGTGIVTEPALITATVNPIICFGETYEIGSASYDTPGMIDETLTAANGCDSVVTGMLTILDDPSNSIDTILCDGDSVVIGNSIYNQNGVYQDSFLTITGCDSIVTTIVFVLEEITLEINATMLPTGYSTTDGEATASVTGGAGGFSFVWSTGATTQDIQNVVGGDEYCVTVTDENDCTASTCQTIFYESNIAIASADSLLCNEGADGVIDLTVQNGLGDYTYFWENTTTGAAFNGIIMGNNGADQITGLSAGNYSITVTDAFVSTVLTLTIGQPTPMNAQVLFPTSNLCQNDCNASVDVEVTGGTSPYTYAWTGGLDPVPNPTNICGGTYQLVVTDANGCTFDFSLDIPEGLQFSSSITEVTSINCGGDANGVLSATQVGGFGPFYSYEWSNGDTDSIANNLTTGTYTVTVFDGAGCTATSSMFLSEPVPITFDIITEDVNCWNGENSGSIVIENASGGSSPYLYSLGGGGYTSVPTLSSLVAGSYQVNVQDENGCVESTNAIINHPDAVNLTLGDDQLIPLGETVVLDVTHSSSNALITWDLDSCQNCPTLELQPLNSTNYFVTVQDTITGCSESIDIWVNVSKDSRVYIPNAFSPNEDGKNDLFMVFADERSIANINTLQIFDRWGAMLYEGEDLIPNNVTAGWDGRFNGQEKKPGVYIYFVEVEFIDGRTEIFKGDLTLMR